MKHVLMLVLALTSALPLAAADRAVSRPAPLVVNGFPGAMSSSMAAIINEAASKFGVDPNLIAAVAWQESRFSPTAVSRIGAEGVMQLKPKTARALGVSDSFDARQNVLGGTKYLRQLLDRFKGNTELALAAYNAGPELVAKVGPRATNEAVNYVAMVKSHYEGALRALRG